MKGINYTPPPFPPSMRPPEKPEETRQQCIEELKRLATDFPDTYITRDFFRANSNIKESTWTAHFGNYPEFLRAAGLWASRYHARQANRVARSASTDNIKPASDSRFRYEYKYDRRERRNDVTILGCSDLHDIDVDPFFMRCFLHAVKQMEPDVIMLGGDIFDFPEVSKYGFDLREYNPVGRLRFARDNILKPIREAAPNAQIDFLEGNHEARLIRHLAESDQTMRAYLSDFHDINDIGTFFRLDEFEINYIAKINLCAFPETNTKLKKAVEAETYKVYYNSMMVNHFPAGRTYHMPGWSGHHHRHQVWSDFTHKHGSFQWHQIGCGCKRHASYTDGKKWNNGFIAAHINRAYERTVFEYFDVGDVFSRVCGTYLDRAPDEYYPELDREVRSYPVQPKEIVAPVEVRTAKPAPKKKPLKKR